MGLSHLLQRLVLVHPIDQRIDIHAVFSGEPHVQESSGSHQSLLLNDAGWGREEYRRAGGIAGPSVLPREVRRSG